MSKKVQKNAAVAKVQHLIGFLWLLGDLLCDIKASVSE